MDKEEDNLFEAFESDDNDEEREPTPKKEDYLGKKRLRDDDPIHSNDNTQNNYKAVALGKLKGPNTETKNNEEVIDDQEDDEDALLAKSIAQITNDDDNSNNGNINEAKDPLNMGMIVDTFPFPGGIHETIRENNYKGSSTLHKSSNKEPATKYPFKLDHFQERAILCLENHQSVLVSAHTSAGKTAVAQYAIAMALRDKQRVIYTSPIKALSNQKYRELALQFKDVGLMTGDVTYNPLARCIVMTTEILRNMLYKGSEITREIAWVIFDEVHYMRDKERGVVWEETIILLSNKINYVFLSATIPNAREFAMWITKLKNQPCNVVYTDFRPVPLQHYVYPSGAEGIYLVVDASGKFREDNFNKASERLNETLNLDKVLNNKSDRNIKGKNIKKIIDLISEQELFPAIVFSFSKKECEEHAIALAKTELTTEDEKVLIEEIYSNAIQTLAEEDQSLPQIKLLLPLLKRGIGIHHGGMLPIVKECVELIFQEGYIKVLFSTETFSMGINMPAKTVVFTSTEKWDGDKHRPLTGGEYIQMSGRAGRRGIDDRGITILLFDKKMDQESCKTILKGQSDTLNSSFHLNYNQLVNLYRIEGMECEYIVKRSFRQFQSERSVPLMKQELKDLYIKYTQYTTNKDREHNIQSILTINHQIDQYREENRQIIIQPQNIIPFLANAQGRLVKIRNWGYGIVAAVNQKTMELIRSEKRLIFDEELMNKIEDHNQPQYVIDVYVYIQKRQYLNQNQHLELIPGSIKEKDGRIGIVPFFLESLENISPIKVNLPQNQKESASYNLIEKMLFEIIKRFNDDIPLMHPIKDLNINDLHLHANIEKISSLENKLKAIEKNVQRIYGQMISLPEIELYKEKTELRAKLKLLIERFYNLKKLVLQDELSSMKRVLRRLEFVKHDIVTLKGQVACNISSGDELLLTEMLFSGFFNTLEPEELAAILSCFLSNEASNAKKGEEDKNKNGQESLENKRLIELHKQIESNAERVADVMIDCKVQINKKEYQLGFTPDYMIALFEWSQGKTFNDLLKNPDLYEGNLIRNIRRLDELIRQMSDCAIQIGNNALKEKLTQASKLIKRGIPFSASLYLNN